MELNTFIDFLSPDTLAIGLFVVVILLLGVFTLGKEKCPYFARKHLLTKTEVAFYKTLLKICAQSFPDVGIAMQVRLGDIINCSDSDWHKGFGPKISAKHIDFVLFDQETTEILLCIELDDSSHNRPDRKRRDKFINKAMIAANAPLLRISTKNMSNQKVITRQVSALIL